MERERIEREEKKEKQKIERDERAHEREKIKYTKSKIGIQELANRSKLESLEKEVELEKSKKHEEKTKDEPSIKHNIRVPKLPPFDKKR